MTIDYNQMPEQEFRAMVRSYVEEHFPRHLLNATHRVGPKEVVDFTKRMAERGWLVPGWPVEWGGMGLDIARLIAFNDELAAIGVPKLHEMGTVMLGPVLLKYGTEDQKREYLPRIAAGEHVWCQGYSEPNSGSDLSSLRLAATEDGDHWVLNGQKIWTTMAHQSNMIFMLARTNPRAVKQQEGISFMLVDLASPGITVRPIRTLSDEFEFCEVFFENVRVKKNAVVGQVNDGWTIAKSLLGFERLFVGSPRYISGAMLQLETFVSQPENSHRHLGLLVKHQLDYEHFVALYSDYANVLKNGGDVGPQMSILKLISSELYQRVTEDLVDQSLERGVIGELGSLQQAAAITGFFQSRPSTIAGGSSQVQRNIIAKGLLAL